MSRLFTLEQATAALPEIERMLRDLIDYRKEHERADAALQAVSRKVMLSGGMQIRTNEVLMLRSQKETSAQFLKTVFEELQQSGCLVKDLDMGLVDFPTMYRDREVYLCWKMGERAIEYWHEIEAGFRGRQKIDQEFLENHRGENPS